MTLQKTIQQSIEKGWLPKNYRNASEAIKEDWRQRQKGQFAGVDKNEMLLDPEFWKALFGKEDIRFCPCCDEKREPEEITYEENCDSCGNGVLVTAHWRFRQVEFINHIQQDKNIESYFEKP